MNADPPMSAAEFQAVCGLLWGDGWRHVAADALGVAVRNVQFWAAEPPARCKPVPPGVAADLGAMVRERQADPAEADRMVREVARMAGQVRFLETFIALETAEKPGRV